MPDLKEITSAIQVMKSRRVIEEKVAALLKAADANDVHHTLTTELGCETASYEVEATSDCSDVTVYITYVDYDDTAQFIQEYGYAKKVTINYTAFIECGKLVKEVITYCPHLGSKTHSLAFDNAICRFNELRDMLGIAELPISVNKGLKLTVVREH